MRLPRVYTPQALESGAQLRLEPGPSRHLLRVLRLAAGAEVRLFDGRGAEFEARILATRPGLLLAVGGAMPAATESPLRVRLIQAVAKGERMDYALQKSVELGVAEIQPVFTERSVVRLEGERLARRDRHWRAVLVSACEQSGRTRLPALGAAVPIGDWLQSARDGDRSRLLLDPESASPLAAVDHAGGPISLLVGPEGGLSEGEVAAATAAGFLGVSLGPRVLRTETAATVALSLLQARFGDLGARGSLHDAVEQ